MELRVLGNAGGSAPGRQLSSYLIDGVLAVDAGSLTTTLHLEEQLQIGAVLLTHGHLDHVATLPYLLIHRYDRELPPLPIVANAYTHETLREHLLNDRVWVSLDVATGGDPSRIPLLTMGPGEQQRFLDRYDVRSIGLNHAVPCQGYWISDGQSDVIVCGDTTTTDELWEVANGIDGLGGILIECAWTDDELARITQHMSPALLLADLQKLKADVPVYVTHRKPGFEEAVEAELRASGDDRLRFVQDGDVLTF
jgi:ribonuclease BN (tRNA processing enzyme)